MPKGFAAIIENELLEARDTLFRFLAMPDTIHRVSAAADVMVSALGSGRKILACGNGGSMCDAMHFAEELSGRFRDDRRALPAMAISEGPYISCVANDYGYEQIFVRAVQAFGKRGDVLLAISTSGNSPNVIAAAKAARECHMKVIALTGKTGGALAKLAHVEIRAPETAYADRAQEIHIKVIHSLIACIEAGIASEDGKKAKPETDTGTMEL